MEGDQNFSNLHMFLKVDLIFCPNGASKKNEFAMTVLIIILSLVINAFVAY